MVRTCGRDLLPTTFRTVSSRSPVSGSFVHIGGAWGVSSYSYNRAEGLAKCTSLGFRMCNKSELDGLGVGLCACGHLNDQTGTWYRMAYQYHKSGCGSKGWNGCGGDANSKKGVYCCSNP